MGVEWLNQHQRSLNHSTPTLALPLPGGGNPPFIALMYSTLYAFASA